ncbi:hypothetical protein BBJ29_001230 [Phytophthora kernoviae]|uniref:Fibronectin type-III domain-containing protein n=1 Tax=Phytophthora kernoviae TaxID=325452 RepID=A0A3F2RXL2_9STRA|nr:hypothetical protein BBJ29_001230 [Phytophthora kernoviae]RLN65304.1 hypothetical protein BBP00_00002935 [Phytophthora kernoviae]
MRLCIALVLLSVAFGAVFAGYDDTVSWTNATVLAESGLSVTLTTGSDPLMPVDAVIKIQLNQFFAVAADATVNATALGQTMDGTWSVSVAANSLTVQRNSDGRVLDNGTVLLFQLTGVTNPIRAGLITVGDLELSNADNSLTHTLPLPTMQIEPGRIWNSHVTFANLLSGRRTSLTIYLTPAHFVPNDGVVVIYLPYAYSSLSTVALSSHSGMDGTFTLATQNNLIRIQRVAGSGTDSAGMQEVVIELSGIVHPLLEGPMGPSVLLQTLDGSSRIIDQEYVDTSLNYLSKAQVQISSTSLRVAEGDITGAQYAVVLSAPPYGDTAITLSIGDAGSRAALTLQPQSVVFTAVNWSNAVQITVTVPVDDHVGLRNDSYEISLLSQPISNVIVHMAPRDPFIVTLPEEVVFTASSWGTAQVINVVALTAASNVSAISGISHQLTSNDINYDGKNDEVFPQNEVLVYFEPLSMPQYLVRGEHRQKPLSLKMQIPVKLARVEHTLILKGLQRA